MAGSDVGMKQLTPVMVVEVVEPCLAWWADRFGFETGATVPGPDGKLLFAITAKDGIELMYQTKASVIAEDPAAATDLGGHSIALYITVASIDAAERALAGAVIVKPRHQTFYGSTEIYALEPGGNTVGFAQNAA